MTKVLRFIFVWLQNLGVFVLNIFIWRSKKVWLFGSWMGEKYADNSRFLFQYINEKKELFGIKKAIWVTKNQNVFEELRLHGFECYLFGNKKSFYYHLKAGVHIICNSSAAKRFSNDICTNLSFGAKKIQLWHGVGIKAVGNLKESLKNNKTNSVTDFLQHYGKPGMWGKCYHLVTSDENMRVAHLDMNVSFKKMILANYPRLYHSSFFLKSEEEVINKINALKNNYRFILYLPTFRDNDSLYIQPQSINGFDKFLKENDLIWIQKRHSASKFCFNQVSSSNIISLDSGFDVNVLYDYIDLLISDYSSASSDAIYKRKLTLEYCPDYDHYMNNERGFVNDYLKYHVRNPITNPSLLFDSILDTLSNKENVLTKSDYIKTFLFENSSFTMKEIVDAIICKIYDGRW